jgi:trehalose/maltose hydrolase-like predicted phosphorylase
MVDVQTPQAVLARSVDDLLSAPEWLVRVDVTDPRDTAHAEALLHLANGYLGLRPNADPDDPHSDPGFYASDLYDTAIGVSREIVNLPTPAGVRVRYGANPMVPAGPPRRVLDMRRGFAYVERPLSTAEGDTARLSTITLTHTNLTQLVLTLHRLDLDREVDAVAVDVFWDNSTGNPYLGGVVPALRVFHVEVDDVDHSSTGVRLAGHTIGTGERVNLVNALWCQAQASRTPLRERSRYGWTVTLATDGRRRVYLDVAWAVGVGAAPAPDLDRLDPAQLFDEHVAEWGRRWESSDILIDGDRRAQQTVRFAQFHLMQNELPVRPRKKSPARGLSAAFHGGATFFDTEIHKDAYWTWCEPEVARAHLMFRHSTLPAARRYAVETGFRGARFPEAADDLGGEAGPLLVHTLRPAASVRRHGRQVVHVSAAVAYAVARYHQVTGDDAFLAGPGYDLVIDTARFAASVLRRRGDRYVSPPVMGVDEYHHSVTNNYYTNAMMRWNLDYALSLVDRDVASQHTVDVTHAEVRRWRQIVAAVALPEDLPGGIPAQDDGYAGLAECPRRTAVCGPAPRLRPDEAQLAASAAHFPTNLIKQADVVLLCHLLPDLFDEEKTRASYRHYERRTAHASSLSAGPHGVVGARVGLRDEAYAFFLVAGRFNLDYTPRADYRNGLHLSAYAAAWQIVVEGFLGLRLDRDGQLELHPRLPVGWTRLEVPLIFRGSRFRVIASADQFEVRAESGPDLTLRVDAQPRRLSCGEVMRFHLVLDP